jgi:hypothetical protein
LDLDFCSTSQGSGLYRTIEAKIMTELPRIKQTKENQRRKWRRRLLSTWNQLNYYHRSLNSEAAAALQSLANSTELDLEYSNAIFGGNEEDDKVYVYICSDNEKIKQGLANYLIGHAHIAVMRVRNDHIIVHAKVSTSDYHFTTIQL